MVIRILIYLQVFIFFISAVWGHCWFRNWTDFRIRLIPGARPLANAVGWLTRTHWSSPTRTPSVDRPTNDHILLPSRPKSRRMFVGRKARNILRSLGAKISAAFCSQTYAIVLLPGRRLDYCFRLLKNIPRGVSTAGCHWGRKWCSIAATIATHA